jgi:NitT/TauT family transport system permease protein
MSMNSVAEPVPPRSVEGKTRHQFAVAPARYFPLRGAVSAPLRALFGGLGLLLLALSYLWLTRQSWVNLAILPTFGSIGAALAELLCGPELWTDLGYSFLRVTAGFLAAALLALPLGILAGSFRLGSALLEPLSEFLRYIPVPALVPLVMIVAGIDEAAKVLLVFMGTFFQLLLSTADEIRRVPLRLVQVSQSMGATRLEIVRRVLTPAALPGISHTLRMCNGWAWSYVVVAELVAATEGLGFRVLRFYRFVQTPSIYVYLLVFGVVGLGLDFSLRALHQRLFRWSLSRSEQT